MERISEAFEVIGVTKILGRDPDDWDALNFEAGRVKGLIRIDSIPALNRGIVCLYPADDFPTGISVPGHVFEDEPGTFRNFDDCVSEPYLLLAARREKDGKANQDVPGMKLNEVLKELTTSQTWSVPWFLQSQPFPTALKQLKSILSVMGGPGSGNYGHKGQGTGEVGGSGHAAPTGDGLGSGDAPGSVFRSRSRESYMDHKDNHGKLIPDRIRLHYQVRDALLRTATPVDKPSFVVFGGGTASGKSYLQKSGLLKDILPENSVKLDSDKIKEHIPEYRKLIEEGDKGAAAYVHEESSMIASATREMAFKESKNVILDGTGDSELSRLAAKVESARSKGYEVNAVYVTVPIEVALERSDKRSKDPNSESYGRVVPEATTKSIHAAVSAIFPEASKLFDNVRLYDTNVQKGETPRLIASGTRGSPLKIHDQVAYNAFLAKAHGSKHYKSHKTLAADHLTVEDINRIQMAAIQGKPCPPEFLELGMPIWKETKTALVNIPKGQYIGIPFEVPDPNYKAELYPEGF